MNLANEIWPKKRKINSKVKGTTNEQKLARCLTDWSGILFSRTPNSGGLGYRLQNAACDIQANSFPYGIETKHYKVITQNQIKKFWEKAKTEHDNPLLFIRTNGMSGWLVYSELDFKIESVPRGTLFEYTSVNFFKLDYIKICEYVKNNSEIKA